MYRRPNSACASLVVLMMVAFPGINLQSGNGATPVAKGDLKVKRSLEDQLVLHYSFDDDGDGIVYDESGNENHGMTVGKVSYEPSFRGRAARFSSNRTYVLSESPGLNMHGWNHVTVSAWIKTNRVTTYAKIISRGAVTADKVGGISLQAGSGISKASFGMMRQFSSNPPIQEAIYTSSLMPKNLNRVGKWVHVVGTFDGQFMRLYVDGKLDRQAEASVNDLRLWDREDHKLVIGNAANKSRMAWSDKYFDGSVDELKIWRRGLSSKEVAKLHHQGAKRIAAEIGPAQNLWRTKESRE